LKMNEFYSEKVQSEGSGGKGTDRTPLHDRKVKRGMY
jgi:hypothetical protein